MSLPYKKQHFDMYRYPEDLEQFLDLVITDNRTVVKIPDNYHVFQYKTLQVIAASWYYIEYYDHVNIIDPKNPIWYYTAPNCYYPQYMKNPSFLYNWDKIDANGYPVPLRNLEFRSIKLMSDIAKTWDESGNVTPLLCRIFKDNRNATETSNSFGYDAGSGDLSDIYVLAPNQTYLTLNTFIELVNYGSILTPSYSMDWKTNVTDLPLFRTNNSIIQPYPNFNRPLFLKLKITYSR